MRLVFDMGCITFGKDFHPEFDGYLWEKDGGVWISSIFVKHGQEGRGHFRNLIKELKKKYVWIKIPTPSVKMAAIAFHYGFTLKSEYDDEAGEDVQLMYWKKASV